MKAKTFFIVVLVAMTALSSHAFAQGKVSLVNESDYTIVCESGKFAGEYLQPGDGTDAQYVKTPTLVMSVQYGKGRTQADKEQGRTTLRIPVPTNLTYLAITNEHIKSPAQTIEKTIITEPIVEKSVITEPIVVTKKPSNFVTDANYVQTIWLVNSTDYRMEGKTGPIEGVIMEAAPIDTRDSTSTNEFLQVGPNLFMDVNTCEFYDGNDTPVTEEEVLELTRNSASSLVQLKVPLGAIEENLKYYKGEVSGLALASLLERMVTEDTKVIVITEDDLDKFRVGDKPVKRQLVNRSAKQFHFIFGEEKEICPPRKSSDKPGFVSMGKMESGIYYLETTFVQNGRIVSRDILIILGSHDKQVFVRDADLEATSWTGQKTLN